MTTNTLFELIKKLPKAELHLHLEGAVTPSLLEKLEEEHSSGETSKISTVEYGESFNIIDRQGLEDARKRILQNLRKPKEYLLPLEEIIRGMNEHNIVYSEVFFSPVHRWRLGLEAEKVLERLLERSSQAEKEEGRSIRWILTCSKSHGPDIARKTVDLAIRYREKGIVAVGLDASGSPDSSFDPEEYARIFAWAKVQGLFIHVHSGESDLSLIHI